MAAGDDGATTAVAANAGPDEFKELADNAPVMIWRSGVNMLCDFFNQPWLAFTGRTMEQEIGMGWAEGVHPDDYDRCVQTYVKAFRAREAFSMDYRLRRHDGVYRWILDNGRPFQRGGRFAGYLGSCIDIEDRKRLEETQRILLEELNHRVKNVLASVQAIAYQTFRGAADPATAYPAFLGRLQAMGSAHDMLNAGSWAGADLGTVARRVARSHGQDGDRVSLGGDPVWIAPKRAIGLSLCLHELFTNAARHGALSAGAGRVDLRWSLEGDRVRVVWTEAGGPPVRPPEVTGFGLRLIETLGREAGGEVRFAYLPDGLVCAITFPPAGPEARPAAG